MKALRERGIPVSLGDRIRRRYTDGSRTICITGSNGKTTTTTLAYEMLRQADLSVGLAGNIGQSFALEVATEYFDWYVIELSSFQLDGMYDFRPTWGCCEHYARPPRPLRPQAAELRGQQVSHPSEPASDR